MKKTTSRILIATLVLAPAIVLAKVAPDLSSPEGCVKSYFNHQQEAERDGRLEMLEGYADWRLRQQKTEMAWYKDNAAREKEYKKDAAQIEFIRANLSELKKFEVSVVDKADIDKSNVKVKVRIKGKRPEAKKDDETKFELKDEDETDEKVVTNLDNKWKIKTK